jgi:predicted ribonuclease YlaK
MLSSKLGDRQQLEFLYKVGKIDLMPLCDLRGFDSTGMKAIIWISEAQNLDIPLAKLAIQRVGEDCQLIIDGDYNTQVDSKSFEGKNNGMKRASQIFSGEDFYGEVELNNIYRSRIAEIADKM